RLYLTRIEQALMGPAADAVPHAAWEGAIGRSRGGRRRSIRSQREWPPVTALEDVMRVAIPLECCGRKKSLLTARVAAPQVASGAPPSECRARAYKVCDRPRSRERRRGLRPHLFDVMTDSLRPQH